jgi:hypothetical protein
MVADEIYEEVVKSKKYKVFPKEFVEKIIQSNINKKDPVKETRKNLREITLMYRGVRKEKEAEQIWSFLKENIEQKTISVLDLGCGEFPKFLDVAKKRFEIKRYLAVDVVKWADLPSEVQFETDNILDPKGNWTKGKYDLTLMLNLIPVIEKMEKGSGAGLLERVKKISRYLLISFPLRSIGGRKYIGHYWKKWSADLKPIASLEDRELFLLLKGEVDS